MCCLGLVASVALASGQQLEQIGVKKAMVPQRIGQLQADGTVSEWMDYGTRQGCTFVEVWDAFDQDGTGYPCCGDTGCGMSGPTYRWYFGPTYCQGYITNDMQFDPGPDFCERLEVAWWWAADGIGENCVIIVEFFTDFDDTCTLGDDGLGDWLGGVIMDFGYIEYGGYYYTDVDLCGLDWMPFDPDGDMGYNMWLATYDDADPDTLFIATCAQFMLWGTNNPASPGPGDQGPIQWDDDFDINWAHEVPDECYDYTYGICPDPLCAMSLFFDAVDDDCPCPGDVDGDCIVGHSDLGVLLSQWGTAGPEGDLDGDGTVGHSDLGILLGDWGCVG
jgi:hypothetical protein